MYGVCVVSNRVEVLCMLQGFFFSKFLMGVDLRIFGPCRSPDGDEVGWGGGGLAKNKRNLTEARTAHLMQN